MQTIKKILERKWNLIHQTFFFTNQKDLDFLITDFRNYLNETKELSNIKERLIKKSVIPSDFFNNTDSVKSWRMKLKKNEINRADFNLIRKIYVFTLNEIDSLEKESVETITKDIYFDKDKSCLLIENQTIKVRKFSDQYHTLRIIFKEAKEYAREWFFSELAEEIDSEKNNDKTYYNAIYQLNQKLAIAGFPNFFITTRQSAKINTKYLS